MPEPLPDLTGFPPVLSVHGDHDRVVPYEREITLQSALVAAGVWHELITLPRMDHTPVYQRDLYLPQILQFFKEKFIIRGGFIMRKSIIRGLSAAAATAMLLSTVGCGGKGTSDTSQTSASAGSETTVSGDGEAAAEPAEIKFSWWGGDTRHEATEKAVAAFMEKYPQIQVTTEYGAWSGWEEKQALNIMGGNAADLLQINWNWIDSYSGNGQNFYDLNQFSDIIDLTQFPQEMLDQCSVDGKLMAIPVSITGCLFYWNQKTFDTVGCEIPTDLDSLFAAGKAFKEYGEDYYPLVIDSGYSRMIFMVTYLESVYGKPWVENNKIQYTAEEIQEGFDFITRLEEEHVIPTLAVTNGDMADSTDKNPKWIDGKYAGAYVWDASSIKMAQSVEESVNVPGQELVMGDFIKMGDYDGGFTKISMAFAIPTSSKSPEAAALLINYLLNDPEGIEICGLERGTPLSAIGAEYVKENNIGDPMLLEANQAVIAHNKFPLDPKFENSALKATPDGAYEMIFGKLSSGDLDSAEATQELIESVNEVLQGA